MKITKIFGTRFIKTGAGDVAGIASPMAASSCDDDRIRTCKPFEDNPTTSAPVILRRAGNELRFTVQPLHFFILADAAGFEPALALFKREHNSIGTPGDRRKSNPRASASQAEFRTSAERSQSEWKESNLRSPAPKAGGIPLSYTLQMAGIGVAPICASL